MASYEGTMETARARRRLEPLPDRDQAVLRRVIRQAPSAEDAARRLQVPVSSLLAGAAGARLAPSTRRRLQRAMGLGQRAAEPHLRLVTEEPER